MLMASRAVDCACVLEDGTWTGGIRDGIVFRLDFGRFERETPWKGHVPVDALPHVSGRRPSDPRSTIRRPGTRLPENTKNGSNHFFRSNTAEQFQ